MTLQIDDSASNTSHIQPGDSQRMQELLEKSRATMQAHKEARQRLKSRKITLEGLVATAILDKKMATMSVRRAIMALPSINQEGAVAIMDAARVAQTRKIGWLISHPKALERLQKQINKYLPPLRDDRPRELPNPNWPWRD